MDIPEAADSGYSHGIRIVHTPVAASWRESAFFNNLNQTFISAPPHRVTGQQ